MHKIYILTIFTLASSIFSQHLTASPLVILPDELVLYMTTYIPPQDTIALASTCKRLRNTLNDHHIVKDKWNIVPNLEKLEKLPALTYNQLKPLYILSWLSKLNRIGPTQRSRAISRCNRCLSATNNPYVIVTIADNEENFFSRIEGKCSIHEIIKAFAQLDPPKILHIIKHGESIFISIKDNATPNRSLIRASPPIIESIATLSPEKFAEFTARINDFCTSDKNKSQREYIIRAIALLSPTQIQFIAQHIGKIFGESMPDIDRGNIIKKFAKIPEPNFYVDVLSISEIVNKFLEHCPKKQDHRKNEIRVALVKIGAEEISKIVQSNSIEKFVLEIIGNITSYRL